MRAIVDSHNMQTHVYTCFVHGTLLIYKTVLTLKIYLLTMVVTLKRYVLTMEKNLENPMFFIRKLCLPSHRDLPPSLASLVSPSASLLIFFRHACELRSSHVGESGDGWMILE